MVGVYFFWWIIIFLSTFIVKMQYGWYYKFMEQYKFIDFLNYCGGQSQAAEILGVSIGYVSHMKMGRRKVSFKQAQKIESITSGRISRKDLRPDIYG